jgi:hypothetical protein
VILSWIVFWVYTGFIRKWPLSALWASLKLRPDKSEGMLVSGHLIIQMIASIFTMSFELSAIISAFRLPNS